MKKENYEVIMASKKKFIKVLLIQKLLETNYYYIFFSKGWKNNKTSSGKMPLSQQNIKD